jgi:CubicO group peptidase (beta-lactamase class C family)
MNLYVPSAQQWEQAAPESAGLSAQGLRDAAAFGLEADCGWPRSLYLADGRYIGTAHVNDKPPHDQPIGIVRPRGGASGLVLRHGRIVAEWGDTARPDTTFSAAKSYLGLAGGLAFDDGLIPSLDARVADSMPPEDDGFASPHNAAITWRQLLQQTSEWQGTLWGKPDSVDHHRDAGPRGLDQDNQNRGTLRALEPPGTRWEYNDVRVNRLALCLTRLFRRPLGEVLRERIMKPIGASPSWEWHGYDNARVTIDGRDVVSVSGGGHWGAGLFISTRDHARVGLLVARGGAWNGRQLISRGYLAELARPCPVNPQYGFLWWLNTGRALFPSIPDDAGLAIGGGQHIVWTDARRDLVAVVRWADRAHCDALLGRIAASLTQNTSETNP